MTHDARLAPGVRVPAGSRRTRDFLESIGVFDRAPATSPFDPGYDASTFEGHLAQSSHLIETMKISMASWLVANEAVPL